MSGVEEFVDKSLDTMDESVSVVAVLSSEALLMLEDLKVYNCIISIIKFA